jgi:hypothetical protein
MIFEVHNASVQLVDEVSIREVEMGEVGGGRHGTAELKLRS